jgi:ATP-dependent Clp protease ATP-binding subunit ClpA
MVWGPYVLYGDPCHVPYSTWFPAKTEKAQHQIASEETRPPDSSGAPTRPRAEPQIQNEGAKESLSLDTGARQVFASALEAMREMNQAGLGTMHLLIGLCKAELSPLKQLFERKNVKPEAVCEAARARSKELIKERGGEFGVSRNSVEALLYASLRAQLFSRTTITAEDLLAGLLPCRESSALGILAQFQISGQELEDLLPWPRANLKFDETTQLAMLETVKAAQESYLGHYTTPHLLAGLIRIRGAQTTTLLIEFGADADKLTADLIECVRPGDPRRFQPLPPNQMVPTQRAYRVLLRAQALARAAKRTEIAESDLLQSILQEDDGITNQLLDLSGIPAPKLLRRLLVLKETKTN